MNRFSLTPLLLASLAVVGCASGPDRAQESRFDPPAPWRGNLNFLIGGRSLDDDTWRPVEDQVAFGLEGDFRPPHSPLGIELGLHGSQGYDDSVFSVDLEGSVIEFSAGPRLTADLANDRVHPYIGGGVTLLGADLEGISGGFRVSDDDFAVAGYAHAGVNVDVGPAFTVGFDVRSVFASDIDLFGVDGDADYWQGALTLGVRW